MKVKLSILCLAAVSSLILILLTIFPNLVLPTKRISVNGLDIGSHSTASFSNWESSYISLLVQVSIDEHRRDFSLHELGFSVESSKVEEYFETLTGFQRITEPISTNHTPLEVSVSIDSRKMFDVLIAWVDAIDPVREATDATVAFDENNTLYYIIDHIDGSMDRENLLSDIIGMIMGGQDLIEVDSTEYKAYANITSADELLLSYVKAWNQVLKINTLNMGSNAVYIIQPNIFHSWLKLDSDTLQFSVDDDAIGNLVSYLSKEFNTMGESISFNTNTGNTITVPGGDYGWWLDTSGMAEALRNLLTDTEVFEMDAVWRQEGGSREGSPIGDSYVEISLGGQYLWLYIDGELKHTTPIITGKPSSPTRRGVFAVTYTQRNGRLRGSTWDTIVDYWMPFDGDIGLHDAVWQIRFGGERYRQGYGSNGCINLPLESAKIIFQYIHAGFPVVVY